MKPLIVFDFDGVIVDSIQLYMNLYLQVFKLYGLEFPLTSNEQFRQHYDSAWENNFTRYGIPADEVPQLLAQLDGLLSYEQIQLFESIDKVIRSSAQAAELAILSSTGAEIIHDYLVRHGLRTYFAVISGGDGTSGKAARLAELVKASGRSPLNCLMIGDTAMDIRSGKAVGTHTLGVTYGWYSQQRIITEKPTYVAENPVAILSHVEHCFANPCC
jgi:phosphoglycolate phosphatase-like HAD superfamily hydrolase